nr:hypothetical protein [Nostoc sp. SerVER01]
MSSCLPLREGENSRFRDYLAGLHGKSFCYSKSAQMRKFSIRLVIHDLKYGPVPLQMYRTRLIGAIA